MQISFQSTRLQWQLKRSCTTMPARFALTSALFSAALMGAALLGSAPIGAQQAPPANPLDAVPAKMPFDVPYGPPISLERAEAAIAATVAEARKHDWKLNVAVGDWGRNHVAV